MTEIDQVLRDPCTHDWVKTAVNLALKRDPVDAAHDAELIAHLLRNRVNVMQRRLA